MSSNRQVSIGVDPHKLSATIEVVDPVGTKLGEGRFATDKAGFAAMRGYVNRIEPDRARRVWAVEGANGAGQSVAQRLLAAGERVVDVPAKLAARVRLFDTGHTFTCTARPTPATLTRSRPDDMVSTSSEHRDRLRELAVDDGLEAIRLLCDRRDELSRQRVQTVNRIHRLLAEPSMGWCPGRGRRTSQPDRPGRSLRGSDRVTSQGRPDGG